MFTVSLKSYANNAIATTSTLTIVKTSPECEVTTLLSSVSAISDVTYTVAATAVTPTWSSNFVLSNAKCAIQYVVNKPTGWDSYITASADKMYAGLTLAMADSTTVPVGIFTTTVQAMSIGGVAQASLLTVKFKIAHTTCETSGSYTLTAGSDNGVAIPTITLGTAA